MKKLLAIVAATAGLLAYAAPAQAYTSTEWNLDRTDQRTLPLSGGYEPTGGYGNGVNVYMLDSGIRISHSQFQGRAKYGYDFVDNDTIAQDCAGHGTHTAGTVAGLNTGVARYANVIAVRVLDCQGSTDSATMVAGLNWVRTHAVHPAVASISIGFVPVNAAVENATQALINSGVTVVASAGNDSANACGQSPAHLPAVITVAASTKTDSAASYSNFGACVDLYAPGSSVVSTCMTSDTATCSMSGTSMAAPAVAGAAAVYLYRNPTATPAQVSAYLIGRATPGKITGGSSYTPNKLLYLGV